MESACPKSSFSWATTSTATPKTWIISKRNYDSKTTGPKGRRLQVILLDTRYHRTKPGVKSVKTGQALHTTVDDFSK